MVAKKYNPHSGFTIYSGVSLKGNCRAISGTPTEQKYSVGEILQCYLSYQLFEFWLISLIVNTTGETCHHLVTTSDLFFRRQISSGESSRSLTTLALTLIASLWKSQRQDTTITCAPETTTSQTEARRVGSFAATKQSCTRPLAGQVAPFIQRTGKFAVDSVQKKPTSSQSISENEVIQWIGWFVSCKATRCLHV